MMSKSFIFLTVTLLACIDISLMAQDLPLKEHEMLKMDEGTWSAKISMWTESDTSPSQSNAIETNTMLGELWSVGKLEGNISGTDFVGYATLGYDPMQKKYVGTWIDSSTPVITHMLGTYDEKTKTLVLFYTIFKEDGQPEKRKNIMIYKDKETRDFTMFIKNDNDWIKSMEILYERIDPIGK